MREGSAFSEYDVVVVGGGPSGLMAAVASGERGLSVLVAEKTDRPCRKLLITGKGRCNVANACDRADFFQNIRAGAQFLQSSYSRFDSQSVWDFFTERGVPLKIERGGRIFPQSDRAADIADALEAAARDAGCIVERSTVTGLVVKEGAIAGVETAGGQRISCRAVIVATGGLSYPKTGSTGDGYRLAQTVGHHLIELHPALVPLTCAGDLCARALGLSLRNVRLTARRNDKIFFSEQGEMLFTHYGISGPLVLTLSSHLAGQDFSGLDIRVDLKPALDRETLDRRILRDFAENSNREFRNSLDALLPRKIIPIVVELSGIDGAKRVNSVTAAARAALLDVIKGLPLPVTGTRPIDEAVVTAGGVELRELDPKTMMSKLVRNLHFAGEVIDADGLTGGFNLGIAFATGHAAGTGVLAAAP